LKHPDIYDSLTNVQLHKTHSMFEFNDENVDQDNIERGIKLQKYEI